MAFVRRLMATLFAYVCACAFAAVIVACFTVFGHAGNYGALSEEIANVVAISILAIRIFVIVTLLPAAALLTLLEWRGIRAWTAYALAGALLAAAAAVIVSGAGEDGSITGVMRTAGAFLILGAGSGTVYWILAGRSAMANRRGKPDVNAPA